MIACWDRDTVIAPTFEVASKKTRRWLRWKATRRADKLFEHHVCQSVAV